MKKRAIIFLTAVMAVFIILSGTYLGIGIYYTEHFFENTFINGINVSDLTVEQAEAAVAAKVEDYQVTLVKKDGSREVITGDRMGYRFVSGGEIQGFLEGQNILLWLSCYLGKEQNYTMTAATSYEEEKLRQAMLELNCFDINQVTAPADAALVQRENGTWQINQEREGNRLKTEMVFELLKQTVAAGGEELDLVRNDCYEKPSVYADDEELNEKMEVLNRYAVMKVTYRMGGGVTEILDSQTISSWMTLDEENQPVFDREKIQAWVAQLAAEYDTIGTWQPFTTSLGETVYVESRTYGWQINQGQEAEELYQVLLTGESAERSPVYYESAITRGENDIGDTYVEIDYTNQRMWYYKDGVLVVDTPVVTGCVANGTESPEGVFCLVGKSEDEILKGEGYETPVEYWMPFYGGVGIHDADSWRGNSYGGTIYQYSGSHGCINTPTANAAVIYQNIEIGTPIVCYKAGTNTGAPAAGNETSWENFSSGTAGEDSASGTGAEIDILEILDTGDGTAVSESTEAPAVANGEIIVLGN